MNSFYNLKLAHKLLLSFVIVLCLTAGLGGFSILQLAKVNQKSSDLAETWMPGARLLLEMKSDMGRYRSNELQHILSDDADTRGRYEKRMVEIWTKMHDDLATYQKLLSVPSQNATVQELKSAMVAYAPLHDKVIAASAAEHDAEAKALSRGDALKVFVQMSNAQDALVKVNLEGGAEASNSARALYASASAWVIGLIVGAILMGLILAVWLARVVSKPLSEAVTVAQAVAAGDLTSRIQAHNTDETGLLLQALQTMNTNLGRVVGDVRHGTDSIATASGQIAAGNQDLSSRTEEQASALQQTAASMEQLTSTVRQNADNARQANQLAASASTVAVRGGSVVSQVVNTMSEINTSSKKIVDIIAVIDGIAFQTNILALNAAVEAARAGEQGRGFAVVASEVRTLAQRSSAAAKEIKTLIDDSVSKVAAGSQQVAHAGQTMEEIVASVRRVTDIMSEISAASDEQTLGIEQISQAITQMDQVTQQNAALVEEATAAAESLQEQAGGLVRSVSQFTLLSDHTSGRGTPAGALGHQRARPLLT